MARYVLDTGSNGVSLQLEYGGIVDAATGGAVTNATTSVKFTMLEVWVVTGSSFYDNSNQLIVSGNGVTSATVSNISLNIGSSSSQRAATLTPAARGILFGAVNSLAVGVTLNNVGYAGTMSGTYSTTTPMRPYSAPATPSVTIGNGTSSVTGHQLTATSDKFWAQTDAALETNGTWGIWLAQNAAGSANSFSWTGAVDSAYRVRVRAKNANATGAYGTSDYWYTRPNAPSGFTATREGATTAVKLAWTNNARYAGSFLIERSVNGGAWQTEATVAGTAVSHTAYIPVGSTAQFRITVRTPKGQNQESASAVLSNVVPVGRATPNAPTNVVLSRNTDNQATLTLGGNNNDANTSTYWESVEWQLQTDQGSFTGTTSLAGNTTTVAVSDLTGNARYAVQVRSVNAAGASAWVQSGYIYTTPTPPTGIQISRNAANPAQVLITADSSAMWAQVVTVERQLNGEGAFVAVGDILDNTVTDNLGEANSANYRFFVSTPAPTVVSPYNWGAIAVHVVTDKSKIPGVDRIYVGSTQVHQVFVGSTRVWADGA